MQIHLSRPEPTTAAEVMARAREVAARQRRANAALPKFEDPRKTERPKSAVYAEPTPVKTPRVVVIMPEWMRGPVYFDAHVFAHRKALEAIETARAEGLDVDVILNRRSIEDIAREALGDFVGVTISDLRGVSRMRHVTAARQFAMWSVFKERKDLSFPAIGKWFGNRDHTTVLHAVRKMEALHGDDAAAAKLHEKYEAMNRRSKAQTQRAREARQGAAE